VEAVVLEGGLRGGGGAWRRLGEKQMWVYMIISYVNIKTSLCQVLVEAVVLKKRKKKWKNTTEVFVSILFLFFHFFIFFLCQVPVATKTSSVSDAIVSYSIDVLYHNLVEEVVLKKRKKIFFLHMYSLYPIFQLSWSIHLMKVRHERSLGLSTVLIKRDLL